MEIFYTDTAEFGEDFEERAAAHLSAARMQRAAAQKSRRSARTVLAAGLLLRRALGAPEDDILRDRHGKPYLPGGACFSLTHGGALAAIAVSILPCGIDAEPLSRGILHAERLFTPDELSSGLPLAALWTRKEAVWKADGRGIALAKTPLAVLQDEAALAGVTYRLRTFSVAGHALSVAAQEEIGSPIRLSWEELVKK